MRNLVESIKNFYKYPNKVQRLSSFFKYEDVQKRFEFCPKGKTCNLLKDEVFLPGDAPVELCDRCMQEYLENSGLSEENKRFLYQRFSPMKESREKDNHWILVKGPSDTEKEK